MFLLSNEVMRELVTAKHTSSEEEVTTALWSCFCEEADISIVSERGAWATGYTTASVITVCVYLTVFLVVTSTGRVLGRVIAYVTQYLPYHTLCKSQYVLMTLSRAWSVFMTFNHNDMSVSTVRVVHRLCVFR